MAERKKKKGVKNWYSVLAPSMFGKAKIAETTSDDAEKIIGRNIEVSHQEFTGDFAKSQIKLMFKIIDISGFEARTAFVGHETTTDYIKRMARRHKSKVDGVFDVTTKDGKRFRVKPSAYMNKRVQTSQKESIRAVMKKVVEDLALGHNLNEFVKLMLDGEIGKLIYKHSKVIYPVKRVEIHKSELLEAPTIEALADEEALINESTISEGKSEKDDIELSETEAESHTTTEETEQNTEEEPETTTEETEQNTEEEPETTTEETEQNTEEEPDTESNGQ